MITYINTYSKVQFVLMFCFLLIYPNKAQSGEFAIINTTFTYTENANAFSCHESPPYPANVPANWLSPNNYWNGSFHAYYEVLDVPTNEPFGFQMGLFQYMPSAANWDGHNYYETCSFDIPEIRGTQTVTYNYGSPGNWWEHWNGHVDFSRVYDFESVGPVMYSLVPGAKGGLSPTSGGGSDAAWAIRSNWFPCTIRIIIVAVSSGSTFSGWDNYINGGNGCTPTQLPIPTYGIDFGAETTDKVIPSSDEYSFNADMSGGTSGTGQKLILTPGQDVYFRTKQQNDCLLASGIQHLDVPSRPNMPAFSIDYLNEKTAEVIESNILYSTSSSFTNPVSGAGSKIVLTPGQDLYFWVISTGNSFASMEYHLDVPDRPSSPTTTLDYIHESTSSIPSTQEWSTSASMTSAVSGANVPITVSPGTDLYFRVKAAANQFASSKQILNVPNRPLGPVYEIDYALEKTVSPVPATDEYSIHSDLASATSGTGGALTVTPGTDLYFRSKASASAFQSTIQYLAVPIRPALVYNGPATITAPTFTIRADLTTDMTGFDLTDLSVTNGTSQNLRENNTFDIVGIANGDIKVVIPCNTFNGASFVSNEIVVYYNIASGFSEYENDDLSVYPNPNRDGVFYIHTSSGKLFSVEVYNNEGQIVRKVFAKDIATGQINLHDLQKGIYILRINMENKTGMLKVILE